MLVRRQLWLPTLFLLASGAAGQAATDPSGVLTALSGGAAPAQSFIGKTQFQLRQNTIIVPVRFDSDGPQYQLILDSGAPLTISAALQDALAAPALGQVDIMGPEGGILSVPVTRLKRMDVADVPFSDIGGVVAWVKPPNPIACLSSDGLLGASLLRTAIWQIDFGARELIVTNDLAKLDHLEGARRIPFKRGDSAGSPRVTVSINDSTELSMLVDLGFNGSLAMPAEMYRDTGNAVTADMPQGHGAASATVFGQSVASRRIGRLHELKLGDLTLRDFPVEFGEGVSDFHIGIDFLRHFVVTLDWMNNEIYLQQRSPTSELYPDFDSYGFELSLQGNELRVGFMWDDSPAARSGMRVGDRLLDIDGVSVANTAFDDFCSIIDRVGLFGQETSPVDLTGSRDGDIRRWKVSRADLRDSGQETLSAPDGKAADSRDPASR